MAKLENWLYGNGKDLIKVQKRHRDHLLRKTPDPEEFSYYHRELSEMSLCVAVTQMKLPPGYSARQGTVFVKNDRDHFHVFGHNQSDQNILCFNPGWFVYREGMVKGQAIRTLISRAPELFCIYNDLIALNGGISEIWSKLGLLYKPK